jgi:formylglycine-generating enzyme required for sulfatase activity
VDGADLGMALVNWGACPTIVPAWATLLEPYPSSAVVADPALRAAISASGLAWRVRDTATQIEMVLIPPGSFDMGCTPSDQQACLNDERPVHRVILTNAFYLGRFEVTQAQWQARTGSNPSTFQSATAEVPSSQVSSRPVERVTWSAVQGFLSGTGMRLPTEAEWEYAYRAGTATAFHGYPGNVAGTNDDSLATNIGWFAVNASGQTHPVGGKAANGFGLHDMAGNVYEWVSDWLGAYPSTTQTNPVGPASGTYRALRGGSWVGNTLYIRGSFRNYGVMPGNSTVDLGFRVARDP